MSVRACPNGCGQQSTVNGTRMYRGMVRRRRKCHQCGVSWHTLEVDEQVIREREVKR